MKKITCMLALALGASPVIGQTVVDFEGHLSNPESYDNGSGGGGAFVFDFVEFSNYYDQAWSSWNGFAISNVTDNTTAGWGNQYASYTGSGAGGSDSYAIYFPSGDITTTIAGGIVGFKITNTAYAAISMRDGDAFGKQFGSPNGADGNPDGTNGEDFFRVWIIASNSDETMKDSIEFYLADYRFPNSQDDYIVDTWEDIDLSNFGFWVAKVDFRFESSDVGQWGINTPLYFAIDDVTMYVEVGLEEEFAAQVKVYPNPVQDKLSISGIEDASLLLTNQLGQEIWRGNSNELASFSFSDFENGMYLLQVSKDEFQTTLSIIR